MSEYDKALDKREAVDVGWLIRSVNRMIRPLVRLCIGRMSCNAFINVIKRIYVEEATTYLEQENPGKKVTKSALALLSGLDSRAVDAIMKEESESLCSRDIWPEAEILGAWASEKTYHDIESETPKVLPIYGKGLTFQTLVSRAAGRNVTCQTVLEKLIQSNNVRVIDDTHVQLLSQFHSPVTPVEKNVFEAGSFAISRLARTVGHNLEEGTVHDKWLQQERWSVKIPADKLKMLRADIRTLVEGHISSSEQLLEANEDPVKTDAHCSIGLGWYYWESPNDRT